MEKEVKTSPQLLAAREMASLRRYQTVAFRGIRDGYVVLLTTAVAVEFREFRGRIPGTAYLFQPPIEYGLPGIVSESWPEFHPPGVTTRGEDSACVTPKRGLAFLNGPEREEAVQGAGMSGPVRLS